jgi:hypothetical protein
MSVADDLLNLIKKLGPVPTRDPRKRNPMDDRSRWYEFYKPWPGSRSKYRSHQGDQECARRLKQAETLRLKREAILAREAE